MIPTYVTNIWIFQVIALWPKKTNVENSVFNKFKTSCNDEYKEEKVHKLYGALQNNKYSKCKLI